VTRGRAVAQAHGCFGCHGPGGTGFRPAEIDAAPSFTPDDLQAYANGPGELREWVRDGVAERFRSDLEGLPDDERPLVRMPAFGDVLSERELDDVVAWLTVLGDYAPPAAGPPERGRDAAARYGCFTCHGAHGRADNPNPGSLKGYIPAWDGADFKELARDEGEIREWILDGSPRRLREHPVARWFLSRQTIAMPAYRGRIPAAEVDLIVAYVAWLRESRGY
jgi:mono/diheme cytochrome c family protein